LGTIWHPSAFLAVAITGALSLVLSYLFLPETKGADLDKVDLPIERDNDIVAAEIPLINMKSIK